jgi:uncharacterized protein
MTALATIVGDQLDLIRQLCARHHVERLELFGSATSEQFDANTSDLDFLVVFLPLAPADRADAYFGLLAALQDVFQRGVDLVETEAVSNPYFRSAIDRQRTVLYAT